MEQLTEQTKRFDRSAIRAVAFDLDGTLLDTVGDLGTAANVTLHHFGLPGHPLEAYRNFVGNGLLTLYRRAAPAGTDEQTIIALRDYGRAYYSEHDTVLTKEYPGAGALLRALSRAGIRLGMVTNKTETTAQHVMQHYFPDVEFTFLWGNNGVRPLKPAPDAGRQMLALLDLQPEQIVFCGDGDTDMAFASGMGFWAAGTAWGYRPREVLAENGADFLLDSMAELERLLLG